MNCHYQMPNNKNNIDFSSVEEVDINKKICTICLLNINDNHKWTECFHCFHKQCISQWLEYSNTCPNCKTLIYK